MLFVATAQHCFVRQPPSLLIEAADTEMLSFVKYGTPDNIYQMLSVFLESLQQNPSSQTRTGGINTQSFIP